MKNFNTKGAAEYLFDIGTPFTHKTLEVWRCHGKGPRYKRIGRKVFYEKQALDDFSKGQIVETTDSLESI